MPQAAITAIAGFLVTAGATAAVASFIATVFVYAASSVLLNAASRALAPKRRGAGLGSGAEVNYFDTSAALRIIYGQVKIGGMETLPPFTQGQNNRELNKVLTLAGHEVDSFNSTHFDNVPITNAQIGPNFFFDSNSDGLVTAGSFTNLAFIRHYRGNSLQNYPDAKLKPFSLSAHARNFATCALSFVFNQSIFPRVPTVTFTLQGKRLYDPRLDVTPGASPTNVAYIAWSSNPALALVDFLLASYGGGYDSTEIDWATVVTAANYCDDLVALPAAATQKRYTCNGVIYATEKFQDNVKALVDTMLGRIIFQDGKWKMYAGSWQTPSFTITKVAWASGLSIRFEQGRGKRFNKMHCFFIDSARDYQRVECLPQSDSGYLAVDGEEIEAETEQLFCTNEFEAQRKTRFLLRQSRNQIVVAGTLPPAYQNIALWDTGTVVFDFLGWSSKTFRAVSLSLRADGAVDAVFAEEQSGDWTDLVAGDYNTQSITALPAQNATTPSEPTSLSAVEQINGTILFTLGTPIIRPMGSQYQIIRSTNSADASVGTVVYQGNDNVVQLVMPTSRHWYYSRSAVNSLVSGYQPNTFGLSVAALGQASQRFARDLVIDPEFSLSSENGRFFTFSRADIYSVSLSGGQVGGRLITTVTSKGFLITEDLIFLPMSQYPLYINDRIATLSIRLRPLNTLTNSSEHLIQARIYAWNGVSAVNTANYIALLALGPSLVTNGVNCVNSSNGVRPNSGQYLSRTLVGSLATTVNPNSYPYVVAGLTTDLPGTRGVALGDKFEIDFFSVQLS